MPRESEPNPAVLDLEICGCITRIFRQQHVVLTVGIVDSDSASLRSYLGMGHGRSGRLVPSKTRKHSMCHRHEWKLFGMPEFEGLPWFDPSCCHDFALIGSDDLVGWRQREKEAGVEPSGWAKGCDEAGNLVHQAHINAEPVFSQRREKQAGISMYGVSNGGDCCRIWARVGLDEQEAGLLDGFTNSGNPPREPARFEFE